MSKLNTLFIEELNQVRGGINRGGDPGGTSTLAAYEEGGRDTPFDPKSSTLAGYEDGGKWNDFSMPSSGSN